MATNKLVSKGQKQESSETWVDGEPSVKVRILPVPAKGGPATVVHSPLPTISKGNSVPAPATVIPSGPSHTSPQSVVLVTKTAGPAGVSASSQQVVKQALSHMGPMNQVTAAARTLVINVPRASSSPAPARASKQLPASIQIPPGMMLIRSDSGHLMLVSQQALAQAQQGLKMASSQTLKVIAPQVIGVTPKPTPAQSLSPGPGQRSQSCTQTIATVAAEKEPVVTFSRETLESVKKCKNFLVTLIKLASSDSRSATMAGNVKGLVRSLLQGKVEAEEFTQRLYNELKSTPQPSLVPFLKKSLPAVRCLTADAQLFIQQASDSSCSSTALSSTMKESSTDTGRSPRTTPQQVRRVAQRPGLTTLVPTRNLNKRSVPGFRHVVLQPGQRLSGAFSSTRDLHRPFEPREDDDINDVASMAGVNLREENAQILTAGVGSVVQSCQDQPFLSPQLLLSLVLHTGQTLGISEVGADVIALISHATQERLRGLLQKMTAMAEHRRAALKDDRWHTKVTDVRSQLRYLEDVESLKRRRKDEEEKEKLLRLARRRSQTEDPQHQLLKQRAKELQQIEEAQLQQREANLTALAAIGPRKKTPLDQIDGQVPVPPRQGVPRVTRVMMRDLLLCLEQDPALRHSLTLYKAML